ncbi:MAG: SDR family oxidoreductase [Bryobacteraceae bacterium]
MPTAIVTGASTGLGREFAHLCAESGYDVVLIARSQKLLEELAAAIRQSSGRAARVLVTDLSQPQAPRQIVESLAAENETAEVLINNAGFGLLGPFAELDEAEQMGMIQVNIGALTDLTRLILPGMLARRKGKILNIASTAAFQPGPLMAVYFATKAYVVSFSSALHNELRGSGVTVTALCPGATKTDFDKRAGMGKTKLFAKAKLMEARTVAEIGMRGMNRGKALVVAGILNGLMVSGTRLVPRQFAAGMARKMLEM